MPNASAQAESGRSVALAADESLLAVGAPGEQSNAAGLNCNQRDDSLNGAGAVYFFRR